MASSFSYFEFFKSLGETREREKRLGRAPGAGAMEIAAPRGTCTFLRPTKQTKKKKNEEGTGGGEPERGGGGKGRGKGDAPKTEDRPSLGGDGAIIGTSR